MQKLNVKKEELEEFFDKFWNWKWWYKKEYKINLLNFIEFKKLFCSDKIDFSKESNNNVKNYKKIYGFISSQWKAKIYLEIRKFIIEKFTEKIKFCPYCGKVPLIYFEKWKGKENSYRRLFQLDHFFPKNFYHKWIINFYNLIPSCNACNHLKWDKNPFDAIKKSWKIFHPYFWWLTKDFLDNNHKKSNYDSSTNINLSYNSTHSKYFKLAEKYFNSEDTFNIFCFIQDKITKIKDERTRFKKSFKSDEELKDYFFKNYYPKSEQEILKYSNWKLKKDLIKNIKID